MHRARMSSVAGILRLLLLLTSVLPAALGAPAAAAPAPSDELFGCQKTDHALCDELCKVDGFWYGNCAHWDGRDYACACLPYVKPLDPAVCQGRTALCEQECRRKHNTSGFCYPHPSMADLRGVPKCQCFVDSAPPTKSEGSTRA